jgi:hypothetical protein
MKTKIERVLAENQPVDVPHKHRWEYLKTEYYNSSYGSGEVDLVICHNCGAIKEVIRDKGYYFTSANTSGGKD